MTKVNPLIGCQCYLWMPSKEGRIRRIGIIEGVSFNGMLKIRTGYGLEAYHHLRRKSQVEVIQPKFNYKEEND